MRRREKNFKILFLVLVFCVFTGANASTVYMDLIELGFNNGTTWYSYDSSSGDGAIDFDSSEINYQSQFITFDTYSDSRFMIFGNFTFQSNLERDASSGGSAVGYFQGGVTATLVGAIMDTSTSQFVYGGGIMGATGSPETILQFTLDTINDDPVNPTEDRFGLYEDSYDSPSSYTEGVFDAKSLEVSLVAGSGGLTSGITLGDGNVLKILDPRMDLFLETTSAADFSTEDFAASARGSKIKIRGTVPEPATLLLIGLGGVFLRRRK